MRTFPFDEHGMLYRERAIQVGFTSSDIANAVHAGDLMRIDTGTYLDPTPRTPAQVHGLRARAAFDHDPELIFTHQTAALLHGVELLKPDLSQIDVVSPRRSRKRSLRLHRVGHLDEIVEIDGLPVVSLELAAVTTACTSPMGFAGALTAFNGALRQNASQLQMDGILSVPMHGAATARHALTFANGNAANPAESWALAQMIEGGLPIPRLQHAFVDEYGLIGYTDFDWDERVAAEFDGDGKYDDYNVGDETPLTVLKREKRRQARLEDLGVDVVRLEWVHLEQRLIVPRVRPRLIVAGIIRPSITLVTDKIASGD